MRNLLFVVPLITFAACQPLETYYTPGVSVAKLQRDELDCDTRALRDAPVATQVRQTPAYYVPPRRYCNAAGQCYSSGGYWEPGHIYTVDPNRGLRARIKAQCMADKGYRPVSIPACPQAVVKSAPPGATQTFPPLTANSCVIRNEDGTWQIVEKG